MLTSNFKRIIMRTPLEENVQMDALKSANICFVIGCVILQTKHRLCKIDDRLQQHGRHKRTVYFENPEIIFFRAPPGHQRHHIGGTDS